MFDVFYKCHNVYFKAEYHCYKKQLEMIAGQNTAHCWSDHHATKNAFNLQGLKPE